MNALKIAIATLALCLTAPASEKVLSDGPFSGIDLSKLNRSQAKSILEASEDFALVTQGRKPKHASVDKKAPLPLDGGTTYYSGRGYRITIFQSIATFGEIIGYSYGPHLTFDSDSASGEFSDVRFYTGEQLEKLKSESQKN